MREIKFRGKRIDNGEWVYGSLMTGGTPNISWCNPIAHKEYELDCADVVQETVGQYTGLQDRNGVDIYEWDVLKITFDQSYVDKPFYIGVVTYRADNGYPAFDLEPWIDCDMNALSWLKSESDPSVVSYEVIGNRFDNPELLGEVRE